MKKKYIITVLATLAVTLIVFGTMWVVKRVEQVRATVHYHANIAFYINGERLDISEDKYMEDIGACKPGNDKSPHDRVHFHEGNMDTVHVHDDGVAWGHLLSNLGFSFSPSTIILDGGQIIGGDAEKKWTYILNGQPVPDPYNIQIGSEDRLLLTYGSEPIEKIREQFETVSQNAGEYNGKYDPGSCQADQNQNVFIKAIVETLDGAHADHKNHEGR